MESAPMKNVKKTSAELRLAYTNMTEAGGPDQAIYYNPLQK